MWIADAATMPETNPVVIVAEAKTQAQAHQNAQYTIGVCITANNIGNAITNIHSTYDAGALQRLYGLNLSGSWSKVEVIQRPKNGTLQPSPYSSEQEGFYQYTPNSSLSDGLVIGEEYEDYFVIKVQNDGITVNIRYYVKISIVPPNEAPREDQCPEHAWKISIAPNATPTDLAYSLSLPAAFLAADYTSPTVTFANLPGAAVGETKGAGANAAITLDTDAAGHGWYIDYTPYLNEDFLPTSNPNEWVAKAGSSAAGKMDMLSVLLHEYGHALGLEHSVDAHDFMGTTLTPGTRRLPTASELTLMAQLVAEAKQNLAGLDGNAVSGNGTQSPIPTPSPIPTLPLGAGFGITFLGLTRRNNNSAAGLFGEGAAANAPAQYDTAANPTLVNGELNSLGGCPRTNMLIS
jgi:hypothetical protein